MWAEFMYVLQHAKHTIMDLFCKKSHIRRILIFIFENLLLHPLSLGQIIFQVLCS